MTRRTVEFVLLLAGAWVVMIMTHEIGHIAGGWLGGATLVSYDLSPWRLPYSLHAPDPVPLLTLWAGPVLGVLMPLGFALVVRRVWAWFIADFCLVANGGYLLLAWISGDQHLDTPRLLNAGAHPVAIAAYCVLVTAVGYLRFRADCVRFFSCAKSSRDAGGELASTKLKGPGC